MAIGKLKPYFAEEDLDASFNKQQVNELYEVFKNDFVFDPFTIGGKRIKIVHQKSRIPQYVDYSETFTHIITRLAYAFGNRVYECNRANRIHWIRPILMGHPCKEIFYYRWKDDDGICKHHYWLFDQDFMVVAADVRPDLRIVTAFCVDKDEKMKFYERYTDFKGGLDCQ